MAASDSSSIPGLVAAVRAELVDALGAIEQAVADELGREKAVSLFGCSARGALRHIQNTQRLLRMIEEKGKEE